VSKSVPDAFVHLDETGVLLQIFALYIIICFPKENIIFCFVLLDGNDMNTKE
jgi:hypothetical protein